MTSTAAVYKLQTNVSSTVGLGIKIVLEISILGFHNCLDSTQIVWQLTS
jgi:hypothetical protein